jgi:RHS repeat-associated protein
MPDQDNMNILEEFLPSGIPANFKTTAIQMLDAALGYMTGYVELNPGIGMGTRGYLLRTTTGGASWVKVAGTVAATLKKTVWLNDTYGYAFGADGELFETRNGGNQWDLLNTYANNITTRIAAVSPIGATKLLAVTADGKWFTIESNYGTATATTLSQPVSITINNLQVLNVTDMTCYPNATGLPLIYITAQTQHSVTNQIGYQLIKGSPNALNGFDWLEQQFTATAGKVAAFYNNTSGYVFGDEGRMIHLETIGNNQVASLTMSGERSPVLEAYFLNKDKGIACFQTATGPQIKVTSDGGSTWTGITQLNGQNFRLSLLQRTAAPTSNLRLVASNGAQTYVLVLATGTNLSVVAQNSTTTPSTAALNASVDALAGVAVGTNYTYYYLKNNQLYKSTMTANNGAASVTWSQASVSYNSIFGITYIPTNVKLSAAVQNNTVVLSVLEQNGNLRILKAPLTSNNFSLSAYSGVSSVALINASSTGTDQYWILRNTNNTVQKIPVLGSSVSTITTTASDLTQVAATEKRLLAFGTNGAIALTDVDVNSGLTNVSFTADPITWSKLPLQALAKNGNAIVVVGDKGTVLYKHNSTDGTPVWNSLGVQTSANLTASAALNAGNWAVVGSQGYSQRLNTTTATSFTTIPFVSNAGGSLAQIFPSVTWKSVGVLGNRICISGSNGTLAFTTDWTTTDWMAQSILNNQHISSVVFKPSGSFTVLTTENGKMYRLVGFNTTENTQLFGPKYNDVHFASSSVGSFVGAHFAVKTTQTGGLIWNSLLPTVITNSGASWTTYTNKITNVWTAQSAQGQAIVLFAGNGIVGQAKNNQVYAQTASGPVTTLKCASAASTNGYYSIGNTVYRFGIHFTNPVSSCVSWTGNSSFVQTGTINALHVFQNTGYVAVGNGFIDYRFQPIIGTGVSLTTSMPGVNLRTVYFHDNRVGIAAGDNFQWVDIEAVTDPLSKVWTSFVFNDVSSVFITAETALTGNTAPTARITALAFGDRSRCVWGGVTTSSYVRYANDLRNRISARFFYDRLGRIVVSQNSRQQAQNRFSYSLYDALGRVVEAGEKTENTPGTNVLAFAQIFGAYVGGNLVPSVIDDDKLKTWLDTQATNTRKEITRSYYDKTHTSILAQLPNSFTPDPLTQRKRIVHVTYEAVFDGNDATYNHATHYDYDIHGNVTTLLQDNADLGALNQLASQRFKRMDYTFDLISGNVHRVDYETNKADQWHHAYSYDADNRITAVYTTSATPLINDPLAMSSLQNEPLLNPTWEKEAEYSYYAHGPLARTVIGEQEVQGLDYVYTLQGWIKGVNSNNLDANNDPGKDGLGLSANHRVAQDVMGYSLHYFNNDYLPIVNGNTTFIADQTNSDMLQNSSDLYNGNIARMVTTITDPNSRAVLPLGNAYRYDQLNRLQRAVSFDQLNGNAWAGGAPAKYENSFTYDANGNILTQTRNDDNNQVIDELAYFYPKNAANKTVRNRLLYVSDNVDYDASDINPGMSASNYAYDQEGRLIQDLQEEIASIEWRVDGKVKRINRIANSAKQNLSFDYDAMGHRIAKHVYTSANVLEKSTYYVLDAQGNTMATYERAVDENTLQISYAQTEKFIYGSSRLGVQNCNIALLGSQNNSYTQTTVAHRIGKKGYELSNHLGNVLSVISDKVIPHPSGGSVAYYKADILQAMDYSPFGVILEGRDLKLAGSNVPYDYGFNGMIKDDELKGEGNSYDFGARMLDSRLGRWLSIDSKFKSYPEWTPYKYALDDPLNWIDVDGNEEFPTYADYKAWAKKNKVPALSHKEMNTQGHWLKEDRQYYELGMSGAGKQNPNVGTAVYYRMANYRNLLKCDASHYKTLDERELFYAWADDYMGRKGHEVKWMCAAANTVNTISWGLTWIADFLGDSDPDIQAFIKKGNKMILDDMINKIKGLDEIGCPLGKSQSLMWDAQALADEQNLIQPLYNDLPASSKAIMQDNFEDFLGAEGSVLDKADRWVYGMTQMGYKGVTKDMMPEAGKSWKEVGLSVDKDMNVTKVK